MPKIERYIRWFGIPVVAFLVMIAKRHDPPLPFYQEYIYSLIFTGIYWNGAYLIFMFFRSKLPGIKETPIRIFLILTFLVTFIVLVNPIIKLPLGLITLDQVFDGQEIFKFFPVTFITSIIIGSFYEGAYFFDKWKDSVKQNEALKNQQLRTQFEVLQNQMSPHFLFNSLNTLTTLIAEDQKVAIEFTEKLSEVYRYILQNKERELVLLSEELDFVRSYAFLLQMRYPENLSISYSIDEEALDRFIAPLTLQMLIENSIKHNVVSHSKPLSINVLTDSNHNIIVRNNLQRKKAIERSTKTGLYNIRNRYSFFGDKEIRVQEANGYFEVTVPLINLIRESDHVFVNNP